MLDKVKAISQEIEQQTVASKEQLEQFRLRYISRKGVVTELFEGLKTVPSVERRAVGQALNGLKNLAQERFDSFSQSIEAQQDAVGSAPPTDLTLPTVPNLSGTQHPLSLVRQRIIQIFERIGFDVADGPEIESDWYNFGALNFPDNHPARDMQDTFFVEKATAGSEGSGDMLLRTHTSNVQIRLMERQRAATASGETTFRPIRSIMPGRVYRNETISARAHCMFHQVEGIYIDRNVGFKDLKDTLYHFVKEMFEPGTQIRFRPSYFPFTEPSAEIDISCQICGGKGCNICKHSGWVEIAGSGMIDPQVIANCGIDPEEYTGFAFGMGIERITQLKFVVNDLRLYTENDVRFLRQFEGV
ncbi:phenylalanine--tRNA ligase subunit alpha [Spirosoma utsteinense]|uniref:Phenylalanine--tRNA ligase alpha subunit n=1 Tax=Spirosoma utsteinense TaxID=2585773 RepID=A0ABR6W1U9_9BACT|nr:phenylalanine--tRNA ligase subunit alpha [Spirosoma utsteinense]MBC3785207.1 phenylalanyl-tRNA synthetase alpha chain [Spirosoma utsteinense]MBC3790568.1 phenylalanyl-tRNA synthetase alpha chain [Spirosoma utsteinense]